MSRPLPSGLIVATLTPYAPDGALCLDRVGEHVERLLRAGVRGIAPAGTTGEFLYLTEAEKAALIRASVEAARGRLAVIAGIWALEPETVGRLARVAEASGADALFLTTPIYYPASNAALAAWYRAARRHTDLPLFGYHIPQHAVNGIAPELFRRLVEEGTLQGIKDSSGRADRIEALRAVAGSAAVYGASDSFALEARRLGADGFISALANVYPRALARIWEGDAEMQARIDRVRALVKAHGGLPALKALLRARGLDFGSVRLPFAAPAHGEAAERELLAEVEALGPLE